MSGSAGHQRCLQIAFDRLNLYLPDFEESRRIAKVHQPRHKYIHKQWLLNC